nr:glutamate-cysteine ligase family protein [Candidatus Freyarchaeota archaeon]
MSSSKRLPFTQGVEIELQIVDQSGALLQGQRLIKIWDQLLKRAGAVLQKTVLEGAPSIVRERLVRVGRVEKERQGRRLPYITVSYRMPGGKPIEIYSFGPDPNISQVTWILELVTPPCETMEELGWWIKSLYRVALDSLPSGFGIISIGFNPKEAEYRSGVTFGDHYHIGLPDTRNRLAAYNLLRCFIPHLIALSVDSPFINEAPTGNVKIKKAPKVFVLSQNSVRSLRLSFNKGQMGPVDKDHYIPYLERFDRKLFDRVVNREAPDDKFVDMWPFTDYGTIEMRVFDTQFSVARRLALIAIIQALAYKATKLVKSGQKLPAVKSDVLVDTREKAVEFGLFGKFFADESLSGSDKQFAKYYNSDPDSGKPNMKLFEAVQSMLSFIQNEVEELGFQEYLKPVLTSVMGTRQLEPPCSPADYLLYLYQSSGGDFARVTSNLIKITEDFCTNLTEDPVTKLFGIPEVTARAAVAERVPTAAPAAAKRARTVAPVAAAPALAPTLSVRGSGSVESKLIVAEQRIPFQLSLTSNSNSETRVTVLGKVLSRDGGEESVVSTAVKDVLLKPGKESIFGGTAIPLVVPFGAFSKTKTCLLQFTVRDKNKNELAEIKTNVFKVIATPNIVVKTSPVPKKVDEGESYDINIQVANNTPQFAGRYQLRIYRRLPSGASKLELEKNLTSLTTGNIPYKLKVTSEIAKEAYLKIRAQVLYKGKVVGEHETPNMSIIPTEEPEPEPQKPEIKVITKLPTQTQPQQVTQRVKPQPSVKTPPQRTPQRTQPKARPQPQMRPQSSVKTLPQKIPQRVQPKLRPQPQMRPQSSVKTLPQRIPQRTQPKARPQPQMRPQSQKVRQGVKAKPKSPLKLKAVTPTVKPTSYRGVKAGKRGVKPAVSAGVSRRAAAKKETFTAKPTVERIVKPVPRVSERWEPPAKSTSKAAEATSVASTPVASRPVAAKRVRESKAVEVSVTEPPKVSLYVHSREKELVLDSYCDFDIEVKNLNPDMAGVYWLNIYYCPVNADEVLVDHNMFRLSDKKKINYRFKMKDLPKSRRFKLRAEVLYQGIVIEKLDSGEILVKSPNINKILKLLGILNVPPSTMSGVRIVPFLEIDVNYMLDPVTLFINLAVSSEKIDIQKEVYSHTIGEDGTYLLPLPMRIRDIPPDVKKASLEVSLSVGDIKIGSKETSFQAIKQKSLIDVTPPLLQGGVKAGEAVKHLLRVRNNSERNLSVDVDFTLLPLNSKKKSVGSTRLKLTPGEQGQIEDIFTPPLYTTGRECFLIARLSYNLEKGKAEEWIASPKFQVLQPQIAPLEVKIKGSPSIPSIVNSGEKVNFYVAVKQNYKGENLKLNVYAISQEGEVKIAGINIKQKKETEIYGSYSWKIPEIPYRTRYLLDVRMTEDGQPVLDRLIKKEKGEIIAVP